jgi:hypothetical protein
VTGYAHAQEHFNAAGGNRTGIVDIRSVLTVLLAAVPCIPNSEF